MHWVYIIKCKNDKTYVGETKNLYSRLNQHMNNKGSKHTVENKPESLCAIYKVHSHYRFILYCREIIKEEPDKDKIKNILETFNDIEWNNKDWARSVEDFITENLLQYDDIDVYGGKYVNNNKHDLVKQFSINELNNVPLCHCGYPATIQIQKNEKYYKLYFTCCIKNVWSNMRNQFTKIPIEDCCNYYYEYMDGLEYRIL